MPEHISLINPYLLNESLPPKLAAERDGIAIDLKLLETRINELGSLYPRILVEGPPGLLTPFVESRNWLETLQMWHPQLIWICGSGAEDLELSLPLRLMSSSIIHIFSKYSNFDVSNAACNARDAHLCKIHFSERSRYLQLSKRSKAYKADR